MYFQILSTRCQYAYLSFFHALDFATSNRLTFYVFLCYKCCSFYHFECWFVLFGVNNESKNQYRRRHRGFVGNTETYRTLNCQHRNSTNYRLNKHQAAPRSICRFNDSNTSSMCCLFINITRKLGSWLTRTKKIKQRDWQRFVDVSNTRSCIAGCRSLTVNIWELNLIQLCLNSRTTEPI